MATEITWTYNKDRTLRARKGAKGQPIIQRKGFDGGERFVKLENSACSTAGCSICKTEIDEAREWAERRLSKKGRKPAPTPALDSFGAATLGC